MISTLLLNAIAGSAIFAVCTILLAVAKTVEPKETMPIIALNSDAPKTVMLSDLPKFGEIIDKTVRPRPVYMSDPKTGRMIEIGTALQVIVHNGHDKRKLEDE